MAKDVQSVGGQTATQPTLAEALAEIAALRARCQELAHENEGMRIAFGAPAKVRMRMSRVINGKLFNRGSIIGTFTPAEGVTLAEAELAIRSHKTEFS